MTIAARLPKDTYILEARAAAEDWDLAKAQSWLFQNFTLFALAPIPTVREPVFNEKTGEILIEKKVTGVKHFAPLELDLQDCIISQLGAGIQKMVAQQKTVGLLLRDATQEHLDRPGDLSSDYLSNLWRLYKHVGDPSRIVPTARHFIATESKASDTASTILLAVSASPARDFEKESFFRDIQDPANRLMGAGKYWVPNFLIPTLHDRMEMVPQRERAAIWARAKNECCAQLRSSLDPATCFGQSQMRSIARLLFGENVLNDYRNVFKDNLALVARLFPAGTAARPSLTPRPA